MGWLNINGNWIGRNRGGGISWQTFWTPKKEPSTLIVTAQTDTTIDFSWTAAAEPEDGYKLKISTDGVTYTDKVTVNNATTTAQATGLTAGVLYYFKVVAYKGTHESIGTDVYDTRFKITIDTTKEGSANNTFVLPTAGAGTYNYFVDWGDGGAEENVVANTSQTHVYAAPGTYQIKVRGTFPRIYFNNIGDKAKLMTIDNWGNIIWSSMISAFYGCPVVQGVWIDVPNTAEVTNMAYMFRGCSAFNQSLANFNTAKVTNMASMFYGCTVFNQSLANFNTAKVTKMGSMFHNCSAFNQSVANFNTAEVTDMTSMFHNCSAFNQSVANFNTAKVTNMSYMFYGCTVFNQSLANFNTAEVTNMASMFYGCSAFNQSVANFNTAKVTNMASMFHNCSAFKQSLATFSMTLVANITSMLQSSDINDIGTTTNYDATLVAWAAQDVPNSLNFHGGTSKYSVAGGGTAARASLVADHLWKIIDGGQL